MEEALTNLSPASPAAPFNIASKNSMCSSDEESLPTEKRTIKNWDLQIRLRQRLQVRVFQCVPAAHARLREAVTSTRSVFKISSPSWRALRDFQQISSPDYCRCKGELKGWSLKALIHCEMFRSTCLAMFWRLCGILCCLSTKHSCNWQNATTSHSQKLLKYFCCELRTATTVSTTAKTQASRAQKLYLYS